jgi:hypothetical protein
MVQSNWLITPPPPPRCGKLGGTSSNEKVYSPNVDVTSYSCLVHHIACKKRRRAINLRALNKKGKSIMNILLRKVDSTFKV